MTVDHDEWAALYKSDPAEFERRRKAAIATMIDDAPEERQDAMHAMQQEIDAYRATHTSQETLAFIMKRTQELLLDAQDQLLDAAIVLKGAMAR